ncbi:ParB N-terminal domain-containing protein [Rhodococcus hoagii]|nr:ParB N-terminal domain-containing protein [Prescottella equi]
MTNTESLELVTVDPTTLLVDTNIRADLRLTKGFLQSIAEHGVMTPPTAVRTADGQLRVRTGHRRTAAAVHNGLAAIPSSSSATKPPTTPPPSTASPPSGQRTSTAPASTTPTRSTPSSR